MSGSQPIQRVLAVGAHPDDCELLCGGTLARYTEQGSQVTICSVARGDKGSRDAAPERVAARRRDEAIAAAGVIGAEFTCLGVNDGEITSSTALRLSLLDVIRRVHPDLILTHWPRDYHADHRATGELVTDASWFAASPGHVTHHTAVEHPVAVFYFDTVSGLDFQPTEYVDISEAWPRKEAMLRCHVSQLGRSAQHGESDLVALARDVARVRGHQCGVAFAEAFRPCLKWKRVRPARLLP